MKVLVEQTVEVNLHKKAHMYVDMHVCMSACVCRDGRAGFCHDLLDLPPNSRTPRKSSQMKAFPYLPCYAQVSISR